MEDPAGRQAGPPGLKRGKGPAAGRATEPHRSGKSALFLKESALSCGVKRERERESKKRAKTSGFSLLQEKIPIKGRKKFRSHIRNTFFAKKEENEIAPVQEKPGPAGNAVRSEKKYRQQSFAKGPALYYTARKEKIKRFFPFFPFFSVQQNFFPAHSPAREKRSARRTEAGPESAG